MSASVYVSTQTDVYFVDTTNQPGTIILPSTNTSAGFFLTFKDLNGTFSKNPITFQTINPAETFEDGTTEKTFNDQFGAYTFISDSNKWYLTGGPHMDSAVISTINYKTLNYDTLRANEIFTSSVLLLPSTSLYSEKGSLFFGTTPSNAWGGAKTANALVVEPGGPFSVVSRVVATGGDQREVVVGANTYTVHAFYAVSTIGFQSFTVTTPGTVEMILVGGGGNGGTSGGASTDDGGGGGGGGEVIDYTGNPIYLGAGVYQVSVPLNNVSSTVFTGPSVRIVARNGSNGFNSGVGGGGGTSGSGLYVGGGGASGGGGGAGAAQNGFPATGFSEWSGGDGGMGQAIVNYFSGTGQTVYVCGGGGGGDGYSGIGGTGGMGGGGNGGNSLMPRLNGYYFGGGGGGMEGGGIIGRGATGAVWIRYTYFSTVYS